jgi:hypothetical protein
MGFQAEQLKGFLRKNQEKLNEDQGNLGKWNSKKADHLIPAHRSHAHGDRGIPFLFEVFKDIGRPDKRSDEALDYKRNRAVGELFDRLQDANG